MTKQKEKLWVSYIHELGEYDMHNTSQEAENTLLEYYEYGGEMNEKDFIAVVTGRPYKTELNNIFIIEV